MNSSAPLHAAERAVALITGGVKRVGLAIAETFAASGFDLVLTYHCSEREALETRDNLARHGAHVRIERVDLHDTDDVIRLASTLADELPRLDVLVHNASIYRPTPINTIDAAAALEHFRTNALAPMLLSSHLASLLAASPRPGGGAIVAMTDIHAGIGSGDSTPRADFAAYAMSKAALAELVRTLAVALAPNVRVNAVAPGVVKWPDEGHESDESSQEAYLRRVPLARAGTPEDAAEAVRWLAMDATYVTGHTVRIDGGRSLR